MRSSCSDASVVPRPPDEGEEEEDGRKELSPDHACGGAGRQMTAAHQPTTHLPTQLATGV